jgi:large subunit ribosomal protein L18
MLKKVQNHIRRRERVRARITGTALKPRLSVFRSNAHISVQVIDDVAGKTLCAAHDTGLKGTKSEKASLVGTAIAEAMKAKKIDTCVFDRGGYLYHGRVKALAEAARAAGIVF